jgi:hypothetical protein
MYMLQKLQKSKRIGVFEDEEGNCRDQKVSMALRSSVKLFQIYYPEIGQKNLYLINKV